jgi:hypothetical protein
VAGSKVTARPPVEVPTGAVDSSRPIVAARPPVRGGADGIPVEIVLTVPARSLRSPWRELGGTGSCAAATFATSSRMAAAAAAQDPVRRDVEEICIARDVT